MSSQDTVRAAKLQRSTKETQISLTLCLDGTGQTEINTGFGMLNHMLTLTAFWAGFDLTLHCHGDLDIDAHHSAEDIGLALGQAFREALNGGAGIERTAATRIPMDEALADVCVDISGRPWLEWRGDEILPPVIAGEERDLWREYYKAFASAARINLHVNFLYGKNGHHLLESVAKGLGRALKQAIIRHGNALPSTKGLIEL